MNDIEIESSEEQSAELDEEYIDEYWSAYREHIHTLLAWGYSDSQNRVQARHNETDITGFIAEAIQNKLDDPDSPLWCDQIALKDDPPIPGGGRTGRKRWRPDLIFESVEKRPRPKYHFEAKRLRRKQSILEYLGEDGLLCFIDGRYAHESSEAGMLGYVQSDNIDTWTKKLQLAIDQDHQDKNALLLLPPQRSIIVVDTFPQEWLSIHGRQMDKHIFIHHLLLDYCRTARAQLVSR
jgi:hypothetical protein